MRRFLDLLFYLLDWVLVVLLAGMTLMVFVNVVMRYGFGAGLDISDEMSRFFFVWLIFLGAIPAMRKNMHMGFDLLIVISKPRTRRILLTIANGLIVAVCILIATGTIMQWQVNATNIAPVTRMPMIWVFGVALPMSIAIGLMAARRMFDYATGRMSTAPVLIDPEAHK